MEKKLSWSVVVICLFVYILHWLYIYKTGQIRIMPSSDAEFYWRWAEDIASGRLDLPFIGLVGYPLFLSWFRRFGTSVDVVILVQHIMMAMSGIGLYFIVKRIAGLSWALISFIYFLFYTPFIMYSSILSPEAFSLFLLMLIFAMLFSDDVRQRSPFLIGLALGILIITRVSFLLWGCSLSIFVPVTLVRQRKLRWFILFTLGWFIPVGLVLFLNWLKTGQVFLSAHGSMVFFIGNGPISTGTFYTGNFFRPTQAGFIEDATAFASAKMGKTLSVAQASSFWMNKAFEFIAKYPLKEVKLLLKKFLLLFNSYEYHDANWEAMNVKILPFLNFSFIFPFSFWAMWSTRKDLKIGIIRTSFVFVSIATILAFINTRYKMMIVFPAIILASLGIKDIWQRIKARKKSVIFALFVVVSFFILGNICWLKMDKSDYAVRFNRAIEMLESGQYEKAIVSFKQLLKERNKDWMAWFALGNAYHLKGNLDVAEACYKVSLSLNPIYVDAMFNLGLIYLDRKDYNTAYLFLKKALWFFPDQEDIVYNFVLAAAHLGKCNEAKKVAISLIRKEALLSEEIKELLSACRKRNKVGK